MVRLQTTLIALWIFVTCFHSVSGQESGEEKPQTIENPSPDGRFAFRNTGDSDSEKQTYDLIDKGSGKVLQNVAESDPDLGPSARFNECVVAIGLEGVRAHGYTNQARKRGLSLFARGQH